MSGSLFYEQASKIMFVVSERVIVGQYWWIFHPTNWKAPCIVRSGLVETITKHKKGKFSSYKFLTISLKLAFHQHDISYRAQYDNEEQTWIRTHMHIRDIHVYEKIRIRTQQIYIKKI